MHPHRLFAFAFALLALAISSPAQNRDPAEEILELARSVDEQLQAIDRLLLESSAKNQVRSKPKELLQQARQRSQAAEDGIDKLIEKLNEMKGQSSSSSQQQQEQQQQQKQDQQQQDQQQKDQQKQQQQRGQQNRRENQTPEFVQQPRPGEQPGQPQPQPGQPQPGQKPGEQPQPDGQPQGGQQTKDAGQNTRGNRQLEPETGPGSAGQGDGSWGELQPYLNALKNRGSSPKVPEKYRKYFEAYLRQQQARPK